MSRIEEIRKEAQTIQTYLEYNVSGEIAECIERLDTLGVFFARSGALQAEVKGFGSTKVAKLMGSDDGRALIATLSPSMAKTYIKGLTADEEALEAWLDSINSACRQQCENLRTIISYEKSRVNL